MRTYLCKIEKQLCNFISTSVIHHFSRTVTDECIILTAKSSHPLSVYVFCDFICVNYADESDEFDIDISSTSKLLAVLETIAEFINELMTGALIYERVYYGHVQTMYRIILINRITKRKINLRDTVLTSQYSSTEPRLVIREKVFFC